MSDILDLDKVFGPDPEEGRLTKREPGRLAWQDAFDPNNGRSSDYTTPPVDVLYSGISTNEVICKPRKDGSVTVNSGEGVWEQVKVIL